MADSKKIVLVDVDGTLVTYHNVLPDSARDAIRTARSLGHRVYPTTGRSKGEFPEELIAIGFDGFIGGNGAFVEDDGELVLHDHLSAGQSGAFVDWMLERGLAFYLETNAGLFGSPGFRQGALEAVRAYGIGKGKAGAEHMTTADVFPELVELDAAGLHRDDVNKISYVLTSFEDLEAAQAAFPDLKHGSWGGKGHDALFGDVTVGGITKSRAIDALVAHRGAALEDTIAFGDATIDIDMIEHCGTGVAMGNGSDEVKAAADLVTGDVEEDGLAHAFERLGLLG